MLLKIAWRNVWRNKARSSVIMAAIAIGIWSSLFMMAFSWGMSEQRISDAIENEAGHIQIHAKGYRDDENLKLNVPADDIISKIEKDTSIRQITSRVNVMALVQSAHGSGGVRINGVVPREEDAFTHLHGKITDGDYFSDKGRRNQLLVSEALAEKLEIHLRSKVVLTFSKKDNETVTAGFKVIGIYATNNAPYDKLNVFARKKDLQKLIGDPGFCNEIAIKISAAKLSKAKALEWQEAMPEMEIEYWGDLLPELKLMNDSFDQVMQIFVGIIMLALAFGIINTMLMAVLERVREIGMLMAVGMSRKRLYLMIVLETMMLALVGGPVGLLMSWATIVYFGGHGIDLSMVNEGLKAFGYTAIVYPSLDSAYYGSMVMEVMVLAILSSLYPAWRAIRLIPVEAIRMI